MNFIKKVFDKKVDEIVHIQFKKFSRGKFIDKAVIKAKRDGKGNFTIITTYEFANDLVRDVAEKLGNIKTNVKGVLVSTNDLTGELDFNSKKQFIGVKQYRIDKEMTGNEIIGILNKFPKAFFALSFNVDSGGNSTELKIKEKAPKSAKPSNKTDEKPNPDFCKLKTSDKELAESFVFEKMDFKLAEISHDFIIKEIVIPEELKKENDFAKIREFSRRRGVVIRKAIIDGREIRREIDFEV
ncbi:MAG: hypothetical protein AABX30_01210 [Nanoarchaeota archaeon]